MASSTEQTKHGMTFRRPSWMTEEYFQKYVMDRVGKNYGDSKPWGYDSPYRIK